LDLGLHTRRNSDVAAKRATRLERKNVIVDADKVRRLQHTLQASSESAAIRIAVARALAFEEAMAALARLRRRGTWGKRLVS
jgi:hypothetical protein